MWHLPVLLLCAACALLIYIQEKFSQHKHGDTIKSGGSLARPFYRIVNLVIYDERNDHERQMQSQLQRLFRDANYASYTRQLFIACDPTSLEAQENNHMLYVGCEESYAPGILQKSIKAMQFCLQTFDFDILIRSNISTIIDFDRLPMTELTSNEVLYASTSIMHLNEPEKAFASGTNIILNRNAVEYIVTHSDALDIQKPDDVAIGEILRGVATPYQTSTLMTWDEDNPSGVVFRNRDPNHDRSKDVRRMESIVSMILSRTV